ncbi:hypothetical protein AJ79_07690 [Helicocarpus griseus UAMH5409]|uniref:Neutral protease 2 n=1 Tax=Helicocarpus griseus UAMH5409 TaxID=1447875 RepID=A0A2B7X0C3_9EURO|nr:hypothetical protein AJ79_07690 [Helicocarpus griseus UAMH5409]
MQLSSVLVAAAALIAPVYSSAIIPIGRRAEGLDVSLASTGNTQVKVSITNTGSEETSVLKVNTFFDESPIKKVNVLKEGAQDEVPFKGIRLSYNPFDLNQDDFQPIAPGQTIDAEFDIAETLDLTEGGNYIVSAEGVLPFSNPECTGITGVIPYKSNEITIHVDGKLAARTETVHAKFERLARRTEIVDSCTPEQKQVVTKALKTAEDLATAASKEALCGDSRKFEQYFRTTGSSVRKDVSERYAAIAKEASSTTSGHTKYHCEDTANACKKGVIAYAVTGKNIVVNCPSYYDMAEVSDGCGGKDQALTIIHEFTHIDEVYSPATTDYTYGLEASISLDADKAIKNADNYNFYAHSVRLNCDPEEYNKNRLPEWFKKLFPNAKTS